MRWLEIIFLKVRNCIFSTEAYITLCVSLPFPNLEWQVAKWLEHRGIR
jgi:hypothetical protein